MVVFAAAVVCVVAAVVVASVVEGPCVVVSAGEVGLAE